MNLRPALPLLAFLLLAPPLQAQMEASRDKYRSSLREISVTYTGMEAELILRYKHSLNTLLDAQTKRGNLEYVLAIKKVIEQADSPTPAVLSIPESYSSLKRLHASYRSESDRVQGEKSTRLISLIKQYDAGLERLQRKLTLEGQIDAALEVRNERQHLDWKSGPRKIEQAETEQAAEGPALKGDYPPNGLLVFQWDERRDRYRLPGRFWTEDAGFTLETKGDVDIEPYFMRIAKGQVVVKGLNEILLDAARASNQLFIECMLRSEDLSQSGPARIITYSSGANARNFTLGQEGSNLVIRLRTTGDGSERTMKLCRLQEGVQHHLIVTYRDGRLVCYQDNEKVLETDQQQGDFSTWLPEQHLLLGNEYGVRRDWEGYLALVQVGTRFVTEPEARMRHKIAARKSEAIANGQSPSKPQFKGRPGFGERDPREGIRDRLKEARDGLQKTREERGE